MPRSPLRPALVALLLSSISLLSAAGCAGPQSKDKGVTRTKNENGETMICHQEYPTGSHIGRTVCRTEEDSERERDNARKLVTTPPPAPRKTEPANGR